MTDKVIENNQAAVMGKIISGFTFSHEIFGEGFYMMDVEVARLSESYDIIPVMVCLLYTSPSPRDGLLSRMPSSA